MHYHIPISRNGTKKDQICFKRDDTGTLDATGTRALPLSLLCMKHTKEARFLGSVTIIKQGSNNISVRLLLLNYAEKVVCIPE